MRFFLLFLFIHLPLCADIPRFEGVTKDIYRGGQPEDLSDYVSLKTIGIRTIINLKETSDETREERRTAQALGFTYLAFPMDPFFEPSKNQMRSILHAMEDPQLQPVFVHCQFGEDRTSLAIAFHRVNYEGWDKDRAWDEMLEHGFKPFLLGLTYFYVEYADRLLPLRDH